MGTGAITNHLDVAQLVLYFFWAFFAVLILYLIQENKREGYPLARDPREPSSGLADWLPPLPEAKMFRLGDRGEQMAPEIPARAERDVAVVQTDTNNVGSPFEPTGNPLVDGVGPAAWAERADIPEMTLHGTARIVPLSADPEFSVVAADSDPRGYDLVSADDAVIGKITDIWVDRSESLIRYFEGTLEGGKKVLVPFNLAKVWSSEERVYCQSLLAEQFADVPSTKAAAEVTRLEEDKIMAYFSGGKFFLTPDAREPFV